MPFELFSDSDSEKWEDRITSFYTKGDKFPASPPGKTSVQRPNALETNDSIGENIVAPGKGLDNLTIGSNPEEARFAIGEPENISAIDLQAEESTYFNYFSKGISLLFRNNSLSSIFLSSGRIGGYEKE